tara:strand:- start:5276 stop:5644 length:369 start_codon:yes stop_codon:yes gene_type:complete
LDSFLEQRLSYLGTSFCLAGHQFVGEVFPKGIDPNAVSNGSSDLVLWDSVSRHAFHLLSFSIVGDKRWPACSFSSAAWVWTSTASFAFFLFWFFKFIFHCLHLQTGRLGLCLLGFSLSCAFP